MRKRPGQILTFVCWGLGALLLVKIVRSLFLANPLAHVVVPALPALVEATPAHGGPTNVIRESERRPPVRRVSTRVQSSAGSTNRFRRELQHAGSETGAPAASLTLTSTNRATEKSRSGETNLALATTNPASAGVVTKEKTNSDLRPGSAGAPPASSQVHHHPPGRLEAGAPGAAPHASTTTNAQPVHPHPMPQVRLANAAHLSRGRRKTTLSPAIQARVNRITDSEILGPVIHPLPMALLGIAGNVAFLRAPDGQTGLVKEGDDLGGIKLLQIGINRVLIEQAGQKKELTIFAGMGGESLLDKSSEPSHEINTH